MENFGDIGSAELRKRFNAVEDDPSALQTRLFKMIDYAKDRYHWYEDQREKKLGLAIGMVTLSGVSLTLIVNSVIGKGFDPASMQFRAWSILNWRQLRISNKCISCRFSKSLRATISNE